MMRNYAILLRLFAKTSLFNLNPPGSKKLRAVGYWVLILFGFGTIAYYIHTLSDAMFGLGLPIGMALGMFGALLMATQLTGVFLSLRTMHGMFNNERDLPFLLSLPISNRAIFAAKYTCIYLTELPFMMVIIGAMTVGFARHYGQGVSTYAMAFAFALLSPALPLVLGSLLSMLTGRVFKGVHVNDTVKSVLGVAFTGALLIAVYALMGRLEGNPNQSEIQNMVLGASQYTNALRGFPLADWAARAIASPSPDGWLMLGFFAPCALLTAILVLLGGNYYAKHALSTDGSYTKAAKGPLRMRQSGVLSTLMLREWRGLIRSPLYAMNSLVSIIISPIIMILPLLMPTLNEISELAGNFDITPIITYITMAIMAFSAMINPGLDTTISREGKTTYLLKIIPVSPARQMAARILVGVVISAVGCLLAAVVMPLAWPIDYGHAFLGALTTLLAVIPSLILSTLPDMFRPKLDWKNEQQAMKQNFNSIIGMFVAMIALLPHIAIMILLSSQWELSLFISMGTSLLLTFLLVAIYPKWANKAFARLT